MNEGDAATVSEGYKQALFAGGCFWCMQSPFDALEGVVESEVGYAGGHVENPTYEDLASGTTGQREVIRVVYDPQRIEYATLVDVLWHNIDPFDDGGQFFDRGHKYSPAFYVANDEERAIAQAAKDKYERHFGCALAPVIEPLPVFYPAEAHHQKFCVKNPDHYKRYRVGSGRDEKLREIWGE